MADLDLQTLIRRQKSNPEDLELANETLRAMRRAGLEQPPELLDQEILGPRQVRLESQALIWAELPDGGLESLGSTPGEVSIPASRVWVVQPPGKLDESLARREFREQEVPGLDLSGSRAPALDWLEGLPLRWLDLESCGLDDDAVSEIPRLEELLELNLSGSQRLADLDLASSFPRLTRLQLDRDRRVGDFSGLPPSLLRLSLDDCGSISDRAMQSLVASAPQLTHLRLGRSKLARKACARLVEFPNLRSLVQNAVQWSGFDPKDLSCLRTLVTGDVSSEDLGRVAACPELNELWVRSVRGSLQPLGAFAKLERLTLGEVEPGAIRALEGLPLTGLGLGTLEDPAILDELVALDGLRSLALVGRLGIYEEDLIADVLPRLAEQFPKLEQLRLGPSCLGTLDQERQTELEAIFGGRVRVSR